MTTQFDSDNMIDLREVTERVDELRADLQAMLDDCGDGVDPAGNQAIDAWRGSEDGLELAELESLLAALKGYGGDHQWEGDWYPGGLIADSYFETAMDELLEDIGDLPRDLPGYLTITVNYDALQQDYSQVEFAGDTYWYR